MIKESLGNYDLLKIFLVCPAYIFFQPNFHNKRKRAQMMRLFLHRAFWLIATSGILVAQETNLSISPVVDSLMTKLIENPGNAELQRQLIDAYLQTFNPELALLEISHAEALNQLGSVGTMMKGRVQASLEQIQPAIKTLQLAYLQSPRDETLLLLGILEYARGSPPSAGRGAQVLQRLARRMPNLSVELLKQYEKFYLNGRTTVAKGIANAMEEIDPVSYNTYFPRPQITVLSPSDNSSTEASQTSVIFEVRHSRPVKSVRVKDHVVYTREGEQVLSVNEEYFQSFTQLVSLSEGYNLIPIIALDVFGYESTFPLTINGISFNRVAAWASPLSDTLKRDFQLLRSYIPEAEIFATKSPAYRALIISGGNVSDTAEYRDRGLTVYDFLTHPYSGFTTPANAKLLIGARVTSQNLTVVTNEWLLKGATFQSVTIVYLAGAWSISNDRWMFSDKNGHQFDFKPILEQLAQLATAGIGLICDGLMDDRLAFEGGLRSLAMQSTIPMNILVVPSTAKLSAEIIASAAKVQLSPAPQAGAEFLSLYDLAQRLGAIVISKERSGVVLAQNPAAKVAIQYNRMLSELDRKLTAERANAATKRKILDFCQDWRRYGEVSRYLNNQLSLADFVVRVDEFLSRRTEGGRESN